MATAAVAGVVKAGASIPTAALALALATVPAPALVTDPATVPAPLTTSNVLAEALLVSKLGPTATLTMTGAVKGGFSSAPLTTSFALPGSLPPFVTGVVAASSVPLAGLARVSSSAGITGGPSVRGGDSMLGTDLSSTAAMATPVKSSWSASLAFNRELDQVRAEEALVAARRELGDFREGRVVMVNTGVGWGDRER